MPRGVREVELTESQYLRLAASSHGIPPALAGTTRLVVTESVRLPKGIEALPAIPTVFERDLDARDSSLKEFNGRVEGAANFHGVATLGKFGRFAEFGSLVATNSGLERFDGTVWWDADFSGSKLEVVGEKARINGNLIDVSGTPLREFSGRVKGNANLSSAAELQLVTSDARFGGDLNATFTSLRAFNGIVEGKANFNGVSTLKTLGPFSSFGSIDARGTGLREYARVTSIGQYDHNLLREGEPLSERSHSLAGF